MELKKNQIGKLKLKNSVTEIIYQHNKILKRRNYWWHIKTSQEKIYKLKHREKIRITEKRARKQGTQKISYSDGISKKEGKNWTKSW